MQKEEKYLKNADSRKLVDRETLLLAPLKSGKNLFFFSVVPF